MTTWLSDLGRSWDAAVTRATGRRNRRYLEGVQAGYMTAVSEFTDPTRLREWLRQAMNAAVVEEYERQVDPLPPFGVDDGRDHARLTIIAAKTAALMRAGGSDAPGGPE
jgi:hypothetical protein